MKQAAGQKQHTPTPWKQGVKYPGRVTNETGPIAWCTHPNDEGTESETEKANAAFIVRQGVPKTTTRQFLTALGWKWTPTMKIGQGCKIHLRDGELPQGTLIVQVSKHLTTVIDGTIFDTYDPSRNGTRCVYGYWTK